MKLLTTQFTFFSPWIFLILLSACQVNTGMPHGEASEDLDTLSDESLAGTHELQVKTMREVAAAMTDRTGVSLYFTEGLDSDLIEDVRVYVETNVTSLPVTPQAATLSPSHLLAIFNMAYEYCHVLAYENVLRAEFFEGTIFGGFDQNGNPISLTNPNTMFASSIDRDQVINLFLDRFWGVRLQKPQSRLVAESEMHSLVDVLVQDTTPNANGTRNVLKGLCTAMLSSAPAMIQ